MFEDVADFITRVGLPTAAAIGLFYLLDSRMRKLTSHVEKMCRIELELLKVQLRTRKDNGGLEDDEHKILSSLERENREWPIM